MATQEQTTRPLSKLRASRWIKRLIKAGAFFMLLFGICALVFQPVASFLIRRFVLPRLEKIIPYKIEAKHIVVTPHIVSFERITITPLDRTKLPIPPIECNRISVSWNLWDLATGTLSLGLIMAQGTSISIPFSDANKDQLINYLQQLKNTALPRENSSSPSMRIHSPVGLVVQDMSLSVQSPFGEAHISKVNLIALRNGTGVLELHFGNFTIPHRPSVSFEHVYLPLPTKQNLTPLVIHVEGAKITPWKDMQLTHINGNIWLDSVHYQQAWFDLGGHYTNKLNEPWSIKGWVSPTTFEAKVDLQATHIPLSALPLSLDHLPIQFNETAEVGANLSLYHHAGRTDFQGSIHIEELSIYHPMLASTPIFPIELDLKGRGHIDPEGHFFLEHSSLHSKGVHIAIDAIALARPPTSAKDIPFHPISWREKWRTLFLRIQIPKVPCQTVLDAIPPALIPKLVDFKLQGQFNVDLTVRADLDRLLKHSTGTPSAKDDNHLSPRIPDLTDDLENESSLQSTSPVTLSGGINLSNCTVLSAPETLSTSYLQHSFPHQIEPLPGNDRIIWVGPENSSFVPLSQISPYFIQSILTTEDSRFMHHRGFIVSEFRSALQKNLEYGSFRFGASSITMQMVKNVLLDKQKTLSRKLQELFLTWYLEQAQPLGKKRILEIYFNVIEFGPGIYGIKDAARHYFGKHPRDLTPRESAWFSSILPNPKKRYVHFCRGGPSERWEKYIDRILGHMFARKRLTEEEYQQALQEKLLFNRAAFGSYATCMERIQKFLHPTQADDPKTQWNHENSTQDTP